LSDTCNDVKHVRVAAIGSDTASAVGVQRYEYIDELVENCHKVSGFPRLTRGVPVRKMMILYKLKY